MGIAKVDCTSGDNKNKDLCHAQGVNGFPTLNVYKDGENVEEFNGKRSLDDLVASSRRPSEQRTNQKRKKTKRNSELKSFQYKTICYPPPMSSIIYCYTSFYIQSGTNNK